MRLQIIVRGYRKILAGIARNLLKKQASRSVFSNRIFQPFPSLP
jgi:hypothetical protein